MSTNRLSKEELFQQVKEYVKQKEFKDNLQIDETPTVSFLAQGEYNLNFLLETNTQNFVIRLNTGSQMNLSNQIKYEYQALEYLSSSEVTPIPLMLDDSCDKLPLGMLVMEYLLGRSLDYKSDLEEAAKVLAQVHQVSVPQDHQLITERNPLSGIWKECSNLVLTYLNSSLGKDNIKRNLIKIVEKLDELRSKEKYIIDLLPLSIVNTEVNSGNFLIDTKNDNAYLVDWEKPLVTSPLQDLSHFKVATTTLWKTNYQLTEEDENKFIKTYCQIREYDKDTFIEIKEALNLFDKFSVLRGISWSAMAWIEYQKPGRLLKNEDTFKKMDMYLQEDFLAKLFSEIL